MLLTLEQLKERLKSPKHRNDINAAVNHELRLRFHSQVSLTDSDAGRAATDFLYWVKTLIPADKFKIFKSFFRFPINTVNTTQKVFSDLEKVFDGCDPVYSYAFKNPDDLTDWNDYRAQKLKEPSIWRTKGFDAMKNRINSVLIVDIPSEQTTEKPEPYFYFLNINNVIDFELDGSNILWIAFKQKGNKVAVFNDQVYSVYSMPDESSDYSKMTLESESTHDLGVCPARFFWEDPISYDSPARKKSPITRHLSTLDELVYHKISRQHLQNYASYPIYVTFEQDCDYSDATGQSCESGFIKDANDQYLITRSGSLEQCPVCAASKLAGAGSAIEVTPPSEENNNVNLIDAVKIIGVDRSSLDYNTEELQRLESVIHTDLTGYDGEMMKNQAVNEKQVIAGFEGRSTILRNIKKNFESAQEWVSNIVCQLRYGESFQSASISYGENFYLYSAEFILSMYQDAIDKKMSAKILDLLENQYFETKYRNNPEMLERVNLIANIDPFRHLTIDQVKDMYEKGQIEYSDYILKVNLSSLLMRFERENININEFGINESLDKRVQKISDELRTYIIPVQVTIQN